MIYIYRSITHTDLNAARSWLLEMGRGASVEDIELIYCMALPREVLQSAEIDGESSFILKLVHVLRTFKVL